MRKVYFKVVKEKNRCSARAAGNFAQLALYYHKGKTIVPKIKKSKILIFGKRSDAETFLNLGEIILRVHARGVSPLRVLAYCPGAMGLFWTDHTDFLESDFLTTPKGTLGADEVTVID